MKKIFKKIKFVIYGCIVILVLVVIVMKYLKEDSTIIFTKNYKNKEKIEKLVSVQDEKIIKVGGYLQYFDPTLTTFIKSSQPDDKYDIQTSTLSSVLKNIKLTNKTNNLSYNFTLEKKEDWKIKLNLLANKNLLELKRNISDLETKNSKDKEDLNQLISLYTELATINNVNYTDRIDLIRKDIELLNKKKNVLDNVIITSKIQDNMILFSIVNLSSYSLSELSGSLSIQDDGLDITKEIILYKKDNRSIIFNENINSQYKKIIGIKIAEKLSKKSKVSFILKDFKE